MPTPDERDLQRLVYAAIRAVDDVFIVFSGEVTRILEAHGANPLTAADRLILRRLMDRPINRVFGLTQRAALTSDLFAAMLRVHDIAAATPYQRGIERIRAIVDRRDPTWWQRIRGQATPTSPNAFLRTMAQLEGPIVDRQRLLRSRSLDPQRRWVPKERWNTKTGYRLSDRLWLHGKNVRRGIDDLLREGIRNGEDAITLAKRLERYLLPEAQSVQYARNGRIYRRNMTDAPRGGWGNVAARRLARTETTRVHGQATIEAAKVTPGAIGIRWRLSANHPARDSCDAYASADRDGLGAGVYLAASPPQYPPHPQCICTLLQEMKSRDDVIADIIAQYGGPI